MSASVEPLRAVVVVARCNTEKDPGVKWQQYYLLRKCSTYTLWKYFKKYIDVDVDIQQNKQNLFDQHFITCIYSNVRFEEPAYKDPLLIRNLF